MKFDELRLSTPLLDAVHASGYETPTPIQARVIPLVLKRKDVLACAQTGTGKTAAFALPILQQLSGNAQSNHERGRRKQPKQNNARRIRSLILAPTRELAQQISDSFSTYGRNLNLKHTAVYGGVNKNPQTRTLRGGVDILVATPGRLLDHMSDGTISLDSVEILVLDEADRMLDMGFMPDIRRILKQIPKKRQTLFLSATMPKPIRELANEILTDPVSVEVARVSSPAESVEHWAYHVEKASKRALLSNLLNHVAYSRALVFTRTKHGADKVVRHLMRGKIPAAAIHGNKSQNARTRALADFKSGKVGVLVATDIAARGLDVDGVSHVINFDLTDEPETYIHRIGRTGRAGASGIAMSFISIEDHENLRDIERLLSVSLQMAGDIPGYVAPKEPVVLQVSKPKSGGGKSRRSNAAPKQAPYFPKKKGTRRPPKPGRNRSGGKKRSVQSATR
ncbi:MAG: ATP-dependent RNA helicase RhlE [Phycisphaerae bacterium]|nr:MAG: ATP-dependent RNA helicase RhlE [Phycisphaerae bacterium]